MSNFIFQYLNAAISGILAILFIAYYFYGKSRDASHRKALEAANGWPLLGHLHLLSSAGGKLPHVTLGALADKYGPIFSIRIGVYPAVVISTWELAKECFTTLDVVVSSRPSLTIAKIIGYNSLNFSFSPYGPFWREIRKITATELFSSRRVELLRDIRVSEVNRSLKELYQSWTKQQDGSGHLLVEMKQWVGDVNMNVILRTVAGKRYYGETAEARRCRKAFSEFFRLFGQFVVGDAVPFLGWLDLGGHVRDMKKTAKELDSIIGGWLEEHRQKGKCGGTKRDEDFMDVMLSVLDGSSDLAGHDSDAVNKATCTTILAGGTDTTTVTIIWALSLLLNNPHVLQKAQEEVDSLVGEERLVNESDISNLVYLQAIIKETLRLYPAGPLAGTRLVTENCTLGGYHISAGTRADQGIGRSHGTRLILNLWKLHRDPRVWPDPLEFKPERFLTTHKDIDVKGQHFVLLPFGRGRRACPGMSFGLRMTYLALATILHAFDLTTPHNAPIDMNATFGLTLVKTYPLDALIKPRLSPSVYY